MSNELTTKPDIFCGVEYRPEQVSQAFGGFPETQGQAIKLAEFYSQSGTVPKDYIGRPGNILVAMEFGAELGIKPLASLQNVAVINGRPSLWGDAVLALVLVRKDFIAVDESFDSKTNTATCTSKRKGRKDVTWTFSFADAKKAEIFDKNPVWKTYPRRMAQMRARGFCIRDMWPDALKGLAIAEEQQDLKYAKDITDDVELSREQPASQSSSEKLAAELGLTAQTTESEQQPDASSTSATDELITEINACKTMFELTDLKGRCSDLPKEQRGLVRPEYVEKQKQLKAAAKESATKSAKEDPEQCLKCGKSSVPLSTCPICNHVYCESHWGLNDDLCNTCFEFDDLATKEN